MLLMIGTGHRSIGRVAGYFDYFSGEGYLSDMTMMYL